jgi:NAD(P)-dependent dehydrogenase (short-subunit alcohol dehydrogenase family)
MWDLQGGVAVVTGAGSGIGRELAKLLAREKMSLALADVNETTLQETLSQIGSSGTPVSTHVVNVADPKQVEQFASDVAARHKRVGLLINNAGVAMHGTFEEISVADMEWLMGINFWGMVYGVRNFLPVLKREPRSRIVNLSSIFGIISPAGQTAYCASKFAVRGFTEALMHELEATTVGVTCVHPGGINTPISRNSRLGVGASAAVRDASVTLFEKRLARTSPATAAARIVHGIKREEPRILIGKDAIQLERMQRLFPVRYWKIMMKGLKKAGAHRGFQPAKQDQPREAGLESDTESAIQRR